MSPERILAKKRSASNRLAGLAVPTKVAGISLTKGRIGRVRQQVVNAVERSGLLPDARKELDKRHIYRGNIEFCATSIVKIATSPDNYEPSPLDPFSPFSSHRGYFLNTFYESPPDTTHRILTKLAGEHNLIERQGEETAAEAARRIVKERRPISVGIKGGLDGHYQYEVVYPINNEFVLFESYDQARFHDRRSFSLLPLDLNPRLTEGFTGSFSGF